MNRQKKTKKNQKEMVLNVLGLALVNKFVKNEDQRNQSWNEFHLFVTVFKCIIRILGIQMMHEVLAHSNVGIWIQESGTDMME